MKTPKIKKIECSVCCDSAAKHIFLYLLKMSLKISTYIHFVQFSCFLANKESKLKLKATIFVDYKHFFLLWCPPVVTIIKKQIHT